MEDFFGFRRNHLDNASLCCSDLVKLVTTGREILRRSKMEDYTSMHMVDSLERKEFKVL